MAKIKLTEKALDKLKAPHPSGKPQIFWDVELKGFGVLVSGKTEARTYIAQRDLPNGLTRRVTVAAVSELKLSRAREHAAGVLLEMRNGKDPKAARRGAATLREAMDQYLVGRKTLSESSRQDYRASVERHIASWLDLPLRDITPDMVEERHIEIASEVKATELNRAAKSEAASARKYSGEATANNVMRALRAFWNFAADRDPNLPQNPVRRLRRQWFKIERRTRWVHPDELPTFYDAVSKLENAVARDYLLLLLFTGFRRGEAATLKWDDIDFKTHIIRVPARETKTKRKLDLPMTDFVNDLLVARRAIGKADFVFPSNSASGHIEEPKFAFDLITEATGIKISAHDLRRTFTTVAESSDISETALKALINHTLGSDVTSGYVQMTIQRLREPAQRVCDKMKELCQVPDVANESVEKLSRAAKI